MARRPLQLAAVGAAVCTLTACGSDGGVVVSPRTEASGAPSSAPSATASASSTSDQLPDYLRDIAVGDCLDNNPGGEWKTADCATGHDFEVSAIVPSKWDKHDLAARSALRIWTCNDVAAAYLGGPPLATFFMAATLPTAADPQSDERIICLTTQSGPGGNSVQTVGPMRGALADPQKLAEHRTCLRSRTTEGAPQFVSCSEKHAAEAVTTISLGNATDPFPGDSAVRAKTRKVCDQKVRAYLGGVTRKDLVTGALTSSKSNWQRGDRHATCFVNIDGPKLTASVKNIKNKPLEDLK
ncbi:septum formation family protein [Flexivirga sp. B27]